MTVEKAIAWLNLTKLPLHGETNMGEEVINMAIQALEEVEQYRALGTVEEIKKKIKTELPYMSLAQARFKSELDEYRNIGTVEELKEAREKQVAKKPKSEQYFYGVLDRCPVCEGGLYYEQKYCDDCGQSLKWGEEDD